MKKLKNYNFSPYWTGRMKVNFLQRVIIIHSYLYYEKDSPVWSDKKFDSVAKELAELQSEMTGEELKKTRYGYMFYDFDGTTGYDLWERIKEKDKEIILSIVNMIEK